MSTRDNDWLRLRIRELVPAVATGDVEIKGLAREPGVRTVLAVKSNSPDVHAVGSLVGPRGAHIKKLVQELNNEKVEVALWSDTTEELIAILFAPLHVRRVELIAEERIAVIRFADNDEFRSVSRQRLASKSRLVEGIVGWRLVLYAE